MRFILLALTSLLFLPVIVHAAPPFSQLEFDRNFRKKNTHNASDKLDNLLNREDLSEDDVQAIEELKDLMGDDAQPSDKEKDAGKIKSGVEAKIRTEEFTFSEVTKFIPPRLKGPYTDKNNNNRITSEIGWKPSGGSCSSLQRVDQLCDKGLALANVIDRFTGEEGFFAEVCELTCATETDIPILTELSLQNVRDGTIKAIAVGKICHLRLENRNPRWLALKAKAGTCSCVPKSCLPKDVSQEPSADPKE